MATSRKLRQRKRKAAGRRDFGIYKPGRELRIKALIEKGYISHSSEIPANAIPAAVELHLPQCVFCHVPKIFYEDMAFACRDCGKEQVWTAWQQRWWYEVCHGNLSSTAVYCRECRKKRREQKEHRRLATRAGIERKRARTAGKTA
jgi:hypothetical protein